MLKPRLVFDTHYYYTLDAPVLRELRSRGYALSVSMSAFIEAWARCRRDRTPALFFGPAKKLAPFIDSAYPIAASSSDLFIRLGAQLPDAERNRARFVEWSQIAWKHAATSNSRDPFYRVHGAAAKKEVASRRRTWLAMARSWANLSKQQEERARTEKRRRELEERNRSNDRLLREANPKSLWKAMRRYLIAFHPLPGMQPPSGEERFNAYMRVMGEYLLRTGRGGATAAANDAQDVLQLQHIGEGAFFMTRERKILKLVDQSRTFQAPWVRTLVEVLTERLPRGSPWGRHARRLGAVFHRRSYDELRQAEDLILARIRSGRFDNY
jgi:hypothetical protein